MNKASTEGKELRKKILGRLFTSYVVVAGLVYFLGVFAWSAAAVGDMGFWALVVGFIIVVAGSSQFAKDHGLTLRPAPPPAGRTPPEGAEGGLTAKLHCSRTLKCESSMPADSESFGVFFP